MRELTKYETLVQNRTALYGAKFDVSDLDTRYISFFNTGHRIKVVTRGQMLTGTIGVMTGCKPTFLLMRRSDSHGSLYMLGPDDEIVGVKRERRGHHGQKYDYVAHPVCV